MDGTSEGVKPGNLVIDNLRFAGCGQQPLRAADLQQDKPKQTYKVGDVVSLETEWVTQPDMQRDPEPHYWLTTITEIFRNEQVQPLLMECNIWLVETPAFSAAGLLAGDSIKKRLCVRRVRQHQAGFMSMT